jgi:hypothetical protein
MTIGFMIMPPRLPSSSAATTASTRSAATAAAAAEAATAAAEATRIGRAGRGDEGRGAECGNRRHGQRDIPDLAEHVSLLRIVKDLVIRSFGHWSLPREVSVHGSVIFLPCNILHLAFIRRSSGEFRRPVGPGQIRIRRCCRETTASEDR